jgi:hypothetical protein
MNARFDQLFMPGALPGPPGVKMYRNPPDCRCATGRNPADCDTGLLSIAIRITETRIGAKQDVIRRRLGGALAGSALLIVWVREPRFAGRAEPTTAA